MQMNSSLKVFLAAALVAVLWYLLSPLFMTQEETPPVSFVQVGF